MLPWTLCMCREYIFIILSGLSLYIDISGVPMHCCGWTFLQAPVVIATGHRPVVMLHLFDKYIDVQLESEI
jgi:hypothetical protein